MTFELLGGNEVGVGVAWLSQKLELLVADPLEGWMRQYWGIDASLQYSDGGTAQSEVHCISTRHGTMPYNNVVYKKQSWFKLEIPHKESWQCLLIIIPKIKINT